MAVRDEPKLEDLLPPDAIAFARGASPSKPKEEKPGLPQADKPVSHAAPLPEGKVAAPLRLAPSVQQRIRRLVFEQSERLGVRVTAQDFMESAIMERLNREEKKVDRA